MAINTASSNLDGIEDILAKEYMPYRSQGEAAYPGLSASYNRMSQHPGSYINNIMSQFQSSPQYQMQLDQMMNTANKAGAAGGVKGQYSGDHLSDMLMNNNMQDWLKNVTGIQGQGMGGLQHFYDTGVDASKNYANDMLTFEGAKQSLGANQEANSRLSRQQLTNSLISALGAAGGYYFGGQGNGGGNNYSGQSNYQSAPSGYSLSPENAYNPSSRYSFYGG